MPALFAYLIALCFLVGGGYGALDWLAAPEPVKLAAKAGQKVKAPSRPTRLDDPSQANLPATAHDTVDSMQASSSAEMSKSAPVPVDPPSSQADPLTGVDPSWAAEAVTASTEQQSFSAHAEIPTGETKLAETAGEASKPGSARMTTAAVAAALGETSAARPSKLPRRRLARHHPEKSKLELMTLRTIEFSDGRRMTQLIPYRGRERALAFGADE